MEDLGIGMVAGQERNKDSYPLWWSSSWYRYWCVYVCDSDCCGVEVDGKGKLWRVRFEMWMRPLIYRQRTS